MHATSEVHIIFETHSFVAEHTDKITSRQMSMQLSRRYCQCGPLKAGWGVVNRLCHTQSTSYRHSVSKKSNK
eukprot:2579443-Pleurochrysis_carterae.AAC.2